MKILVICHGAINRSPAAGTLLAQYPTVQVRVRAVKEYGDKDGKQKVTKKMREAFPELDFAQHRAQTITQDDVDWSDRIFYMDGGNRKRLEAKFPDSLSKAICLASYLTIPMKRIADPNFYSARDPRFKQIVDLIKEATTNLGKTFK